MVTKSTKLSLTSSHIGGLWPFTHLTQLSTSATVSVVVIFFFFSGRTY